MNQKLNALVFGYATAITAALGMIALGIVGRMGFYMGAVEMMQKWHMFFSLSITGIIAGAIEGAIISFIAAYVVVAIYNKLLK